MEVPDCPALHPRSPVDEESLIKQYFERGYTYEDIRAFLEAKHGTVLTQDQLGPYLVIISFSSTARILLGLPHGKPLFTLCMLR